MDEREFAYDVGLSFAGEQRDYVESVADALRSRGISVFLDKYERAALWGKNLYEHLCDVYQNRCRYCILFVSADYARKVWTNHERKSAQARAISEKSEYILPARFDDTEVDGLLKTISYIDLRETSPDELVEITVAKIGTPARRNYLPPVPDRLFELLGIEDDPQAQEAAHSQAWSFLQSLRRMTADERNAVLSLFRFGCDVDLPENVHINADLLRRHTGRSIATLERLLGDVQSLGFTCSVRKATESDHCVNGTILGESYMFDLTWVDLRGVHDYPEMVVAHAMVEGATENYCEEHGGEFLDRLDFSQLATVTATVEASEP